MDKQNIENSNIINSKKLNVMNYIYDEQFITLINAVSSSIRDYLKNNKIYMNNLKLCTDIINEQTLFSKSAVNDILVYLNQITKPKFNGTLANMNEKYIKDKLFSINDRINKINQSKNNFIENIKNSEMTFANFYEEAKNLFKKMKMVRNENIDGMNSKLQMDNYVNIHSRKNYRTVSHSPTNDNNLINSKLNSRNKIKGNLSLNSSINNSLTKDEEYSKLKFKYNELLKENQNLKFLAGLKKRNLSNNSKKQIPSNNNISQTKMSMKSRSLQKNISPNNDIINNINSRNPNQLINTTESTSLTFNKYSIDNKIQNDNNKIIKNTNLLKKSLDSKNKSNLINQEIPISNSLDLNSSKNCSFQNNTNLASMVLSFIKQMKLLQDSISKKADNIHEMKKTFEFKKKELIKLSENILENSNVNINLITVNNSQNFSPRNKKNFSPIIQQTPEKDLYNNKDSLRDTLNQLNEDIIRLKEEIKLKDENIKNEKTLNLLKDNELNNEKSQNKTLKEQIDNLQSQIKELSSLSDSQINTIKNLTNMNNELLKGKNEQNERINSLLNENQNYQNKANSLMRENKEYQIKLENLNKENIDSSQKLDYLNKENYNNLSSKNNSSFKNINELNQIKDKNQELQNEISSLKIDNQKLKKTISDYNTNMITLTNTNEEMIKEKDKIIDNLRQTLKELNTQIESQNNNNLNKDSSNILNDEIINLKKSNSDFKEQITSLNKENRDLKNRMAEIKNDYVSHDEDLENLRKGLVEINDNMALKMNQYKDKNLKIESIRDEYSKKIKQEEKNNEIMNDNEIYTELENNKNDYSNYINKIKEYIKNITDINSELKNKIIKKLDKELNNELTSLKNENTKLKEQIEKLKNFLHSNKKERDNDKEQNKTLSDINEQNSNFIDDDLSSVSNIFLEENDKIIKSKNEIEKEKIIEKEIIKDPNNIPRKEFDKRSFISQPNPKAEHFSERKLSQGSGFSAEENYKNNLKIEMENVKSLTNTLDSIKNELKETIKEKNELQKKVNLLSKKASLVDDNVLDKIEVLQILKQTFEKLVESIQLVGNAKELCIMIFKLLNYSEENIKKIMDKKEKRNLFGIFK